MTTTAALLNVAHQVASSVADIRSDVQAVRDDVRDLKAELRRATDRIQS